MSVVTNVILHIGLDEGNIDQVNEYFERQDHRKPRGLVSLDAPKLPPGWYGGTKMLECDIFVGAYNYLDLEAFVKHLQGISWDAPELVQLIVMEQDDQKLRFVDLGLTST